MESFNRAKWLVSKLDSLSKVDPDKFQSPEDRKAYQNKWSYFRSKADWEKWILFSPHKLIKYAVLDLWGNVKKDWGHPQEAFETESSITIVFDTPNDEISFEIEFFLDKVRWSVKGGDTPNSMEELHRQTDLIAKAVNTYPSG